MMKKKKAGRVLLSFLLTLAMVIGFMPGRGMTAHAEEQLLTTITATGSSNATQVSSANVSYSVENVAIVSFSSLPPRNISETFGCSYAPNWGWWGYGWSATVNAAEGYTITKCVFYDDANRTATDSEDPFVVETTEDDKTPRINGTPIDGGILQSKGIKKIEVYGYANPTTVDVTGVSLNKTTSTLTVGDTETLTATVSPDDASDKSVTWSSDNTSVATVDSTGKVTAVSAGNANISVTATNGTDDTSDDKTATCAVTVTENNGDTQQNPDGTKTVTKENADGKTISVTNYSKTDEQISQFVFEKAKGTTVDLTNVNSKNLKTVVVPESVKANGNTYKVTRIRKGFLKNCEQATKVDIGKNINTIDKNAFNYGKKVKKVVIRGKLKKVGKNAFKNTKKNVVIKVKTSAKNFEKNKKLLEKSGLPKNATIKRVKNKK